MNLGIAPPSTARPDDPKVLKLVIEERNDIIKRLQQQQTLLKATLLESTTNAQEAMGELYTVKLELESSQKEVNEWKAKAFQSLNHTISEDDVVSSTYYQELEKKYKELEKQNHEMKKKHIIELQEKDEAHRKELESKDVSLEMEKVSQVQKESEKKIKELEEIIEGLKSQNSSKTKKIEKDESDEVSAEHMHMLVQQLRAGEQHSLILSEQIEQLTTQLQLEIERRNNCRKCRKKYDK